MPDHLKSLEVSHLEVGYNASLVIFDVSFQLPETGITALVGRNGAGKTTLLQSILGFLKHSRGDIKIFGETVNRLDTYARTRLGVGYVPQEKPVFSELSVKENILMGGIRLPKQEKSDLTFVLDLFPKLANRLDQKAGTMSGGERKMVGIARALMGKPRILIMDEPTEGVWVGVVDEIKNCLVEYGKKNAILIVEQNLDFVINMASQVMLLERGVLTQSVYSGNQSQIIDIKNRLTI